MVAAARWRTLSCSRAHSPWCVAPTAKHHDPLPLTSAEVFAPNLSFHASVLAGAAAVGLGQRRRSAAPDPASPGLLHASAHATARRSRRAPVSVWPGSAGGVGVGGGRDADQEAAEASDGSGRRGGRGGGVRRGRRLWGDEPSRGRGPEGRAAVAQVRRTRGRRWCWRARLCWRCSV